MSLVTTPAILLRAHPYSETSQILRFYTRDLGIVAVVAKGVRQRGGRHGGSLSTFAEGALSVYARDGRELQTFKDFHAETSRMGLAKDPHRFSGAAVLGEMVLKHAGSDGNPALFLHLSRGLDRMEDSENHLLLTSLLLEIWTLISALGYAPSVHSCVECGVELGSKEMGRFDFPEGGILCPRCKPEARGPRLGPGARAQLAGLLDRSLTQGLLRPRAHLRLASDFITYHISGGTPLRSMEVLGTLIPQDRA